MAVGASRDPAGGGEGVSYAARNGARGALVEGVSPGPHFLLFIIIIIIINIIIIIIIVILLLLLILSLLLLLLLSSFVTIV